MLWLHELCPAWFYQEVKNGRPTYVVLSLLVRGQELYDLINRDYADFILVSSKLSGVGGKVADLREPMAR